ncbi:transglutaminase domain-containing protein [Spirosoma sp. SC4-14]|uniref:transglutaminase domain-containing protein n=1 Tax=Spirosoma sp. SC4-14 TaxID=3128900 RepID=UPI0030CCB650
MRNYIIWPILAFLSFFTPAFTARSIVGPGIPRPSKFVEIDYSTIDTYARNAPESAAKNLTTLSDYLTSPARTDLAKARSVYAWITSHIRYDESAFSGRRYSSEIDYANRTLRNRRAVCTGFALLFKHILGRTGIPVVTIKGYSRTNDSDAGQPIAQIDHEWNAVQLDGDWYLLDIAWAQTTAKVGTDGQLHPNDFFFLTEPLPFAANHFPLDQRWQLLSPSITKAQFDHFPKLYDTYFRLGFDPDFPKNGLIRSGNTLTLSFRNDQDIEFMCSIGRQGGSTATDVLFTTKRLGNTYQLSIPVSQQGNLTLYVFAKPKGARTERVKSFEGIAAFTIVKR